MFIEDGKGGGFQAHVDGENRLSTLAQTLPSRAVASIQGDSGYFFTTSVITLTSANESGLLYIKNLSQNRVFVIETVQVSLGLSTGGTAKDVILKVYPNPTAGTLLTAGTSVAAVNSNFGSTVPAQAQVLVGTEGSTIVPTATNIQFILRDQLYTNLNVVACLPIGTASALSITPGTANTSMKVVLAVAGFYIPDDFS
jgi:hypothetical protein